MEEGVDGTTWEVALRLVGTFYVISMPLVMRAAAMDALLDRALTALGSETPPEQRQAERFKRSFLVSNSVLIGIGGVWLMVLSTIAAILFMICAIAYSAYLLVLAPRFVDPFDEPGEAGRRQSQNALVIYLVATIAVLVARMQGVLAPPAELSTAEYWFAVTLSAAIPAYAAWMLLRTRPASRLEVPAPATWNADPDIPTAPYAPAWKVLLVPTWDRGVMVDPKDFEPVYDIEGIEISEHERHLMDGWGDLFASIADPNDPHRQRFLQPERQAQLEQAGREIYDLLRLKLPPDRLSFEPVPRPHVPAVFPRALKVMADFQCHALWHDAPGDVGNIDPYELGLSFSLTRDLMEWAVEFDRSIDWDDPGGPPLWSAERHEEHDRQGARLALRVADELRRTGRNDVPVRYAGGSAS